MRRFPLILGASLLAACSSADHLGKAPSFSEPMASREHSAMVYPGLPQTVEHRTFITESSLWRADSKSLLGDRRALQKGDIMTVVIEIDDKAEISNTTSRSREGSDNMSVPDLFGVPQRIGKSWPDGSGPEKAVDLSSKSKSKGDGSVRRKEKLTLRVAATVVEVLPNGVLAIEGTQEVRVNFEMRELLVNGYVRPEDISRQNEITYDKIASARISYGGRGQISDMQQPRYGRQILEAILPF
ncbi:flagellar basal body L-ring protein FlgH [Planktotalea arctica]|uniref:flagellar basal body L-ring protein FlgH n=1 Tax=Planktotalea arctica TaxID=1481893 RepID=UPI000A16E814|nr:flagellar basal body L-ring protein FlgH [Planktotalea arctica]